MCDVSGRNQSSPKCNRGHGEMAVVRCQSVLKSMVVEDYEQKLFPVVCHDGMMIHSAKTHRSAVYGKTSYRDSEGASTHTSDTTHQGVSLTSKSLKFTLSFLCVDQV